MEDRRDTWERYIRAEYREIEDRRNGELRKVLGDAVLPGETREELDRIAREDQEKALEGLAVLRSGDEVWYKHVDELTREDRPARIEAQRKRIEWVTERLKKIPRSFGEPTHAPRQNRQNRP